MRSRPVAVLLIPFFAALGCDDKPPTRAGVAPTGYEASSLGVRLALSNEDDEPVATGPGGAARLGACESRGLTYVYYAAPGWSVERARQQCDELHGTFE